MAAVDSKKDPQAAEPRGPLPSLAARFPVQIVPIPFFPSQQKKGSLF